MGWAARVGATLLYMAVQYPINHVINAAVHKPYMDEIFHVPQVQAYCAGDWARWDPKITTLPGSYIASIALEWLRALASRLLVFLGVQSSADSTCHLAALRLHSNFWNAVILVTAFEVTQRLYPQAKPSAVLVRALVVVTWPLVAFFGFLYYTDAFALASLLLSFRFTLAERNNEAANGSWLETPLPSRTTLATSAAWAAAAILARQTNAVWVAFILATIVLRAHTSPSEGGPRRERTQFDDNPDAEATEGDRWAHKETPLRHRANPTQAIPRRQPVVHTPATSNDASEEKLAPLFQRSLIELIPRGPLLLRTALGRGPVHTVLLAAFAAFVVFNGGVVVGDRENHAPVAHYANVIYFFVILAPIVVVCVGIPTLVRKFGSDTTKSATQSTDWTRPALVVAVAAILGVLAVRYGTLAHPFILADNRHFTFYVWKRFLAPYPNERQLLGVVAAASATAIVARMGSTTRSSAIAQLWLLAVAATLIPAHLIELRYFTPGIAFGLLLLQPPTPLWEFLVVLGSTALNAVTVWIFLKKTFVERENQIARIMW